VSHQLLRTLFALLPHARELLYRVRVVPRRRRVAADAALRLCAHCTSAQLLPLAPSRGHPGRQRAR
jgi:hypothetical protein